MEEKIILAPGASGTELLRTLARFNGGGIGIRIMNAAELARYALQLSGEIIGDEFLPRKDEPAVIYSFVRDIKYFGAACFKDAVGLADALYSLRLLITDDDERKGIKSGLSGGEFPEKNEALAEVYSRYIKAKAPDGKSRIDSIALVRFALQKANCKRLHICTVEEFPLSPLEKKLADKLSDGSVEELTLCKLANVAEAPLAVEAFVNAYGASNEAESVLGYILKNKIKLDSCTVAVTDTAAYSQLFYELCLRLDIDVSFGCGIPIMNAFPAQLTHAVYKWDTVGYHGFDALKSIIFGEFFDRTKLFGALGATLKRGELEEVIKLAGHLRLSYDGKRNARVIKDYGATLKKSDGEYVYLKYAKLLGGELALGCERFVGKYAVIRKGFAGRIDRSAVKVIEDALSAFRNLNGGSVNDIIPDILSKTVCSEGSKAGSLYVTGINGALSTVRERLFVTGLSAALFPGAPNENYLLLDSDYSGLKNADFAPTSERRIARKKQGLLNLLRFASALGVKSRLSFSSYDASGLREQNASSSLYEIYCEQAGGDVTFDDFKNAQERVGFFDENLSPDTEILRAFRDGKTIKFKPAAAIDAKIAPAASKVFSPTAIEKFMECRRRFLYEKVLYLEAPQADDPFTVLEATDSGHIAHELMRRLDKGGMDRDTFLAMAGEEFDKFLCSRPPMHASAAQRERADFLKMMGTAYDENPGNEVVLAEQKLRFEHPCGLILQGYPDRIEKAADGKCYIVDFKTGRSIKHKENDIISCIQALIYAYVAENNGFDVAGCEYRYLRYGKSIKCKFNAEVKAELDEIFKEVKAALDTGEFAGSGDCKVCDYADVCGGK